MTSNFDHIEHAKMIYQFQPNAFTAAAYQIVLQLDRIKAKTEADSAAAEAAKKEAKRRLAEIKEQQAKMRWQPIDTAPKDKLVLIAFYWKKDKEFYEDGATWDIGIGQYNGGRYVDVLHLDLEDMDAVWMPLPELPNDHA